MTARRVSFPRWRLVFPVLVAVSAGPSHADPVREAVDAGNYFVMKSFETRDAATLADHYTEDARLIPPGAEPVIGRPAIAAFWGEQMKTTRGVKLQTLSVEAAGDYAIEEGVARIQSDDGTESAVRYVVVWKRVGRRWHLHRDIWNAGPAEAPVGAEPGEAPVGAEPGEAPAVAEPATDAPPEGGADAAPPEPGADAGPPHLTEDTEDAGDTEAPVVLDGAP